jgi:hypothetical protein
VATRTKTDDLEELREKILAAVRDLVGQEAKVDIGWLDDSPDEDEVLVEVTLADPGSDQTWGQDVTNAIRTAVRNTTAEVLPSAVATTRLVSSGDDG